MLGPSADSDSDKVCVLLYRLFFVSLPKFKTLIALEL